MKIAKLFLGLSLLIGGFLVGSNFINPTDQSSSHQKTDNQALRGEMPDNLDFNNTSESESGQASAPISKFGVHENAVINLFEKAAPSVVFITTSTFAQRGWSMDATEIPQGSGTGFMWDDEGHIVTNFHVLDGGNKFTVTLSDQSSYDAIVVGAEPSKDLAVLKIDKSSKIKALPKGTSSDLKVGQFAYAIGNPFGFDQTLTTGVVSALGREITAKNGRKIYDVIQTDAAINPGNSGGPLLNSSGQLIGVNTAIYSPSGAYSGIGFSIPVDVVSMVVPDLINFGRLNRPIIGVELVNPAYVKTSGAMISRVIDKSPASMAGLRGLSRARNGNILAGDLIKAIDDKEVKSNVDLLEILENYKPEDEISLTIDRKGTIAKVALRLASSFN